MSLGPAYRYGDSEVDHACRKSLTMDVVVARRMLQNGGSKIWTTTSATVTKVTLGRFASQPNRGKAQK